MKLFSFLDETAHIPNCLLIKKKNVFTTGQHMALKTNCQRLPCSAYLP